MGDPSSSDVDKNSDSEKTGWDDDETEVLQTYLISLLVFLVLAWLGWFFRHQIVQIFRDFFFKKIPPSRAMPYVIPVPPRPNDCMGCSADVCASPLPPPPNPAPTPELIHWHWVSTGKPPSPAPEFRGRSRTIVNSNNFRARHVRSNSADFDSVRFSIGGYDSASYCSNVHSLSLQSQSLQSQKSCFPKMSNRKFKILLGRICGITDPEVKREIFDLTFDIIQLGDWNDHGWKLFVSRLFAGYADGDKYSSDLQNDLRSKGVKFPDVVRAVLQSWLTVNGIEKADMMDIYEALECSEKLEIAHNAAINVVLQLRHKQGRTTADCTDPFSDVEETPPTSFEHSMPSYPESLHSRSGQKIKCLRHKHHPQHSMKSGDAYPSALNTHISF